jgi:adenylate cyclase class IV
MTEVEKKFRTTDEGKTRLMNGAKFVNEKTFTDMYWDTADFNLTRQDRWLRQRDKQWELKWPLHPIGGKKYFAAI